MTQRYTRPGPAREAQPVRPSVASPLADALLPLGIAERITDAEVVEEDPPPALPP
jgi:hypothetical protein